MIESEEKKILVVFEGHGGAGKTTLIRYLAHDLADRYKVEILDKKHPSHTSILFTDDNKIHFKKGKYANFCFRWTRLFLYLNHIISSDSDIFLLDRGFLTSYIHGMNDEIPQKMLFAIIEELLSVIPNIDYKTVFVDCDLDVANRRLISKVDVDIELKKERNLKFASYLKDLQKLPFISNLLIINTTHSLFTEYERLLNYIEETPPNKR